MTEKDKYQLILNELIEPIKGFVSTLTKKSELLINKVKSVEDNKDSDEKYPSAKAVFDFFNATLKAKAEQTANKVTEITEESTDEQYPSAKAVYDLFGNIEVSGGVVSGVGLNSTAISLLIQILKECIYSSNVSGKIDALETALAQGGSGGSGSGGSDDSGDSSTSDDITVTDGIMTIISVGSEISVTDGVMTIL